MTTTTKSVKLSESQKYVVRKLMAGKTLIRGVIVGSWLLDGENDTRSTTDRTFNTLLQKKIIEAYTLLSPGIMEYVLTDLGKNIII